MQQEFTATNDVDDEGRPAGGDADATGIMITWQKGPLREQGTDDPAEPNGAFVETVIAIAKQRIEHYQEVADGRFACEENASAIYHLGIALEKLNERTQRRTNAGVEGTHQGN